MLRVSLFPSWPKKNSKKEHKWKNRSCLKVIHNPSNTIKSIRLILLLVLAFCGPIITDCQKVAAKWCFQSCVSVSLYVPRGLPCDHDLWCISPHCTRSLHPAPPSPHFSDMRHGIPTVPAAAPLELDMWPLARVRPLFKLVHLRIHTFPPTGTRNWWQVGGTHPAGMLSCRSSKRGQLQEWRVN